MQATRKADQDDDQVGDGTGFLLLTGVIGGGPTFVGFPAGRKELIYWGRADQADTS